MSERNHESVPLLNGDKTSLPSADSLVEGVVGRADVPETVMNMMKAAMGTGCLALPYACQQGGILFFTFGMIFIASWNLYSVSRLCHCLVYVPSSSLRCNRQDSLPAAAENGQSTSQHSSESVVSSASSSREGPPDGSATLGLVAWHAFGDTGFMAVDTMLVILFLAVLVSYETAVIGFLQDTPLSMGSFLDAFWVAMVIGFLTLVPDVGHLSRWSVSGLLVLCATISVIAIYGILGMDSEATTTTTATPPHASFSTPVTLWPTSLKALSNYFGIVVFGFGLVPITYNFRESMRKPDRVVGAAAWALAGIAILYVLMGVGLYLLFPGVVSDVLHEIPQTGLIPTVTRLAMVLVVTVTSPLLIVPCGELLEARFNLVSPKARACVRFGIALASAFCAVFLPGFVQVLAFVGCACVGTVGFVMPPLLHMRLGYISKKASFLALLADALFLAWGVFATLLTTAYTMTSETAE